MNFPQPLLAVRNLHLEINTPTGVMTLVNGVELTVNAGEILGLVGESGCGKSITAMSIL
jgi:ABC-type dipeptide/oligopeptide/nickel transport system ATPase component